MGFLAEHSARRDALGNTAEYGTTRFLSSHHLNQRDTAAPAISYFGDGEGTCSSPSFFLLFPFFFLFFLPSLPCRFTGTSHSAVSPYHPLKRQSNSPGNISQPFPKPFGTQIGGTSRRLTSVWCNRVRVFWGGSQVSTV